MTTPRTTTSPTSAVEALAEAIHATNVRLTGPHSCPHEICRDDARDYLAALPEGWRLTNEAIPATSVDVAALVRDLRDALLQRRREVAMPGELEKPTDWASFARESLALKAADACLGATGRDIERDGAAPTPEVTPPDGERLADYESFWKPDGRWRDTHPAIQQERSRVAAAIADGSIFYWHGMEKARAALAPQSATPEQEAADGERD